MKRLLASLLFAVVCFVAPARAQLFPFDACGTLVAGTGWPIVFRDQNDVNWSLSNTLGFGLGTAVRVVGGATACSACLLGSCVSVTSITLCPGTIGVLYCGGRATFVPCPCPGFASVGECLNSPGYGANISARGSASVANDTVVLTGAGLPNGPMLDFQITQGSAIPFGDGVLCAAGTIVRLAVKTNAGGKSSHPAAGDPSLVATSGWVAGDVRFYPGWYRDSAMFCTSATYKLTDAVGITCGP